MAVWFQADVIDAVVAVVRQIIVEAKPRLLDSALSGRHSETINPRHKDNFLSRHDVWLHKQYRRLLAERFSSFIYASEEGEPEVIGAESAPDLCIFVDPLDTSELAVRALHGYTHVVVYSRQLAKPIAAVVGDLFHHVQIYLAYQEDNGNDVAYLMTADAQPLVRKITVPVNRNLPEVVVTNYLMRPAERFMPLAGQQKLLSVLSEKSADGKSRGRIGVDFGSIGLCHIAAGFTDAMVEFAKGFAIWDLYPGQYILNAAGGVTLDLQGKELPLHRPINTISDVIQLMKTRQPFIAANNKPLAQQLLATLTPRPT